MATRRKTGPKGKRGGARRTDLQKVLEGTREEIEQWFSEIPVDTSSAEIGLLLTEIQFVHEFCANDFKSGPAIKKVTGFKGLTDAQLRARARSILKRPRVQSYIAAYLAEKAAAAQLSLEWVIHKYKTWATLDITEFLEFEPGGKGRRPYVKLKTKINELPPEIRQCIKSIQTDSNGNYKVEFIDQKSAVDALARVLGYDNARLMELNVKSKGDVHLHFDGQDENA